MALAEQQVRELLGPFRVDLTSAQVNQLLAYLNLLLRWNQKINLTAIRGAEDCVVRHFGESLHLAGWVRLQGTLLDIGSGAGFPGLALKIAFPEVTVTLLEPVAKKRAFLKEVARACGMTRVDVRAERLEEFVEMSKARSLDVVTARAVGRLPWLVAKAAWLLRRGGRLCLWLTRDQAKSLARFVESEGLFRWAAPLPIPMSRQREIWVGVRSIE